MKVGITIGKFMPLHKGHEFMIETASQLFDKLIVIISSREQEDKAFGMGVWARACLMREKYINTNIEIQVSIDISPIPKNIDENGTVLDPEFQEYWVDIFRSKMSPSKSVDYTFVSSDMYGQKMAELLGIKWLPIDPGREAFSVSATMIRNNKYMHWDMVSDSFRPYLSKVVAIVGPESTGKTTLSKHLSKLFNHSVYVPEYGRILSEIKNNNLSKEDFDDILRVQHVMINTAASSGAYVVFTDTEAVTTDLFLKKYLNTTDKKYMRKAAEQANNTIDHYFVMAPTVPWVDDGTRVMPDQAERERFFNELIKKLDLINLDLINTSYTIVTDTTFEERTSTVVSKVQEMLYN